MNALGILIILLVSMAGVLAATVTTIFCLVRLARDERDRQLFHAYVHSPHELEAWLVSGALEQLEQTLSPNPSRR
ncbi:MAG: hypothetical protein PHC88_09790 [Terrimicrobiaceae bacterium]|nr:hypothetical protein [Terrimicrobiaceae bacterium]